MKTVRKRFIFLNTKLIQSESESDFKIQALSFLKNLIVKTQTSSELGKLIFDVLKK
jgi:hypothetical protein